MLSFLAVSNKYCYPKHLGKYNEILEKSGLIINEENVFLNSNAERIAVEISLALLAFSVGKEATRDLISGLSYLKESRELREVQVQILRFFKDGGQSKLPQEILFVIFQKTLEWLESDYVYIQTNAAGLLATFVDVPELRDLANHKIMDTFKGGSPQVKRTLLRCFESKGSMNDNIRELAIQDNSFQIQQLAKSMDNK